MWREGFLNGVGGWEVWGLGGEIGGKGERWVVIEECVAGYRYVAEHVNISFWCLTLLQ